MADQLEIYHLSSKLFCSYHAQHPEENPTIPTHSGIFDRAIGLGLEKTIFGENYDGDKKEIITSSLITTTYKRYLP